MQNVKSAQKVCKLILTADKLHISFRHPPSHTKSTATSHERQDKSAVIINAPRSLNTCQCFPIVCPFQLWTETHLQASPSGLFPPRNRKRGRTWGHTVRKRQEWNNLNETVYVTKTQITNILQIPYGLKAKYSYLEVSWPKLQKPPSNTMLIFLHIIYLLTDDKYNKITALHLHFTGVIFFI